ncbi:MAG: peptide ABC transporter substrate-binding protein [Anaerolineales bacterium]
MSKITYWMMFISILIVLALSVTACANQEATEPAATPSPADGTEEVIAPATEEPTATPEPTPTATPEPKTLVVCQGREPETLYMYGGASSAAQQVFEAIYDGPIDQRSYDYQPIILEKLPDFEEGDALLEPVTVQAGDLVVDSDGNYVELTEGTVVHPAACYADDCAVEFDGAPLEMDRMVAIFKIKEGVSWSDGAPVTADDSVYSWEVNSDPATPFGRYIINRSASYEAIDARTVMWTGLPGYIDNLYYENFWTPLPRHLLQDELGYEAGDLLEAEESAVTPLGWGAFAIQEWIPGDHITLTPNPHYFRADEGLPYIDTLIFRFVENPDVAVAQLVSGECDIVTSDAGIGDQTDLLLQMAEENLAVPSFAASTVWEYVNFGINPAEDYERPDFFGDVRMRHAIAHCLNRQQVVDVLLYGHSVVPDTYIPPQHPLHATDILTTYPFDPERGQVLLEEIGWVDIDEDGVREAQDIEGIRDGTELAFTWLSTTDAMRVQYMELFQADLARCGIAVNLEYQPPTEYFADGPDGPIFGRRFDLSSYAWMSSAEPDCSLYTTEMIPTANRSWSGQNYTGFSDVAYDRACRQARQALAGAEAYTESYHTTQRIFTEQLPAMPLFMHVRVAATRPNVVGFMLDPTERSGLWNIEAIDLE